MLNTTNLLAKAKILVAVSGGADSLVLLLFLLQAKFDIVAAHVNHGLRGEESDEDEKFVAELCAVQKIVSVTRRVVCENASEDAARRVRYAALVEMARENDCAVIVTGHTADDVVETVLMHWLRGASVAGLAGIPPRRALDDGLILVRPLLGVTRIETREFCRAAGWTWREDSSNSSPAYTRNRVRELLPLLAESGAVTPEQLARQTSRAAGLWREESEFLDGLAAQQLVLLTLENSAGHAVLNGLRFAQLPSALARRVLRMAARNLDEGARETGSEAVETVRCHVAAAGRHAVWQWPGGVTIEWTGPLSGNRLVLRSVCGEPENSAGLV